MGRFVISFGFVCKGQKFPAPSQARARSGGCWGRPCRWSASPTTPTLHPCTRSRPTTCCHLSCSLPSRCSPAHPPLAQAHLVYIALNTASLLCKRHKKQISAQETNTTLPSQLRTPLPSPLRTYPSPETRSTHLTMLPLSTCGTNGRVWCQYKLHHTNSRRISAGHSAQLSMGCLNWAR